MVAYDATSRSWLISTLAIEGQINTSHDQPLGRRLHVEPAGDAIEDSADDGITFDKNWIACDNSAASPHRGRCYLVYTDTVRNHRIAAVASTDGGATWSAPAGVPVTDAVGAFPVIRPSGELVVAFYWDPNRIATSRSTDGALTFSTPVVVGAAARSWVRGPALSRLPSPLGRRRSPGARLGRVARVRGEPPRERRVRVDIGERRRLGSSAQGHLGTECLDARDRDPPEQWPGGDRLLRRPLSGNRLRAHRVAAGRQWLGLAAPLSAQTMPLDWMPDTVSGRMLADYVSVHYAGSRPLVLWALASEPVGSSLRQAVYATRG